MIFSDLDGTFLDHSTYSCARSLPALRRVLDSGDSVVLCSSKTAAEIRALLSDIGLQLPFISENGGAIFLPQGRGAAGRQGHEAWSVIPLGMPRPQLLQAIASVRNDVPAAIRGFADMTEAEVAGLCGFSAARARLAMLRDFDEPIAVEPATPGNMRLVRTALKRRGLTLTRGGRFFHVTGPVSKGIAVQRMISLIRAQDEGAWSVGIGDSGNDVPMLRQVDLPIVVQKPDGSYDLDVVRAVSNIVRVPLPGPEGWAEAMTILLHEGADSAGRAADLLRKGFNR